MEKRSDRIMLLRKTLEKQILVLDGALGTAIQDCALSTEDFGGAKYDGCNEYLSITRPDVIQKIHADYLRAGCDIIETNTFGATPLVLGEYDLADRAYELNKTSAEIARRIAEQFTTPEKPRFVAGSMGPTTKAISVTGGITFDALREHFYIQAKGLLDGGIDYFLLETCQDTRNVKAALVALDRLIEERSKDIPIAVSCTIEPMGTMLAGQSVEAFLTSLSHRKLLYIGLNCATGPEFMTDHIRSLARLSPFPIACVPNAGLPDESGNYLETPEMICSVVSRFIDKGWVNLVGGCCGTHAGHIKALAALSAQAKPRVPIAPKGSYLSGVDFFEVTDDARPVIVGERTNVIGSKKFKTLICEEKFDEASEIGRSQIKGAAHIIDICLANPERNELEDMRRFIEIASKKIRAPFMIDSTDERVIELALTYSQGKAIINSINLEDGEERFARVIPLAKKFGAALVVGTIDDDPTHGMAISRARKLSVAKRSYELLSKKYGIPDWDIYWDPLVFPCATGDAQYLGSAVETIEAIRLIKKEFPDTKTILGVSNVSFGLPPAGREILNSVFLYHCVQAGLDLAIVNAEKLERYASIPDNEKKLASDLLFNRGIDPIAAFTAHFRLCQSIVRPQKTALPLSERLPRYIIEGTKEGLKEDLNEALKTMKPLEIVNGPLMKGMDEVGRLFNANQLIVAEVLQSAEVMKAAVTHLEPFMEHSESAMRGKVLLATVKGDVHDIGKNLVEIILANNGFKVVNMGIRVPTEQLIQAVREHNPDIVGLSGLLVKSAQQMVLAADDFSRAGITTPILVGGAALTEGFVDRQIAKAYTSGTVAYASDAMDGLELAKTIVNPERFEQLKAELLSKRSEDRTSGTPQKTTGIEDSVSRSALLRVLDPAKSEIPTPPDFDRHVLRHTPLEQIWKFLNPLMLYGRHLGIRGGVIRELEKAQTDKKHMRELENKEPKALAVWRAVQEVKNEYLNTDIMRPAAIYQFFKASSHKNKLNILRPNGLELLKTFEFLRQVKPDGLCLCDYVLPATESPPCDNIALFIVTAGKGVRETAETLKARGEYLKSHIIQALALETAEAYAELLHSQLRKAWGFADPPETTMLERFQAKYRGKRYSFGYPACPKLDDQMLLFDLLKPDEIGVQLTEGFMMDPEASVSALVFHHPQATYFSVGHRGAPDDDNR